MAGDKSVAAAEDKNIRPGKNQKRKIHGIEAGDQNEAIEAIETVKTYIRTHFKWFLKVSQSWKSKYNQQNKILKK